MALNGPGLRDRQRAAAYRLDHVYLDLICPPPEAAEARPA
jgi:hypothetical protein